MRYQEIMETLSECRLGAVLIAEDSTIVSVNAIGDRLLHGQGKLPGTRLQDLAAPLCEESEEVRYASVAFGEYLLRCPSPAA